MALTTLKNLIEWIKRLLIHKKDVAAPKPYSKIRSITYPGKGTISLVQGRDTDHAVRTWQFEPLRDTANVIYVCLDSLSLQPGERRTASFGKTHRVQILSSSRYLNKQGRFSTSLIFTGDYDMLGNVALSPDMSARSIIDKVVTLFKYRDYDTIDWAYEIEKERREQLGLAPLKKPATNTVTGQILGVLFLVLSFVSGDWK